VSPYGNLLRVPKEVTRLRMPEMQRVREPSSFSRVRGPIQLASRILTETVVTREKVVEAVRREAIQKGLDESHRAYEQVGRLAGRIESLDMGYDASGIVGLEGYGLERFRDLTDVDTDLNPILTMTCHGLSRIDGRIYMTFNGFREYESHHDATMCMEEMRGLARSVAQDMEATRSTLRWTDDFEKGTIEMELHVPKPAFDHLKDAGQLEDAILLLLGSEAASGKFRVTGYVDQSPCKVGAVDVPRRADGPFYATMVGESPFHPAFAGASSAQTPDPFETEPVKGVDVEGNVYMQIGKGRDHSPAESRNPDEDVEGLERLSDLDDLFTGLHPMQVLEKAGSSVIDGRAYLSFVANAEYEGPNELERLWDTTMTLARRRSWRRDRSCGGPRSGASATWRLLSTSRRRRSPIWRPPRRSRTPSWRCSDPNAPSASTRSGRSAEACGNAVCRDRGATADGVLD
jgi:hypothetical protein